MKSIILCEGRTDAGILKYYMEKVNGWTDKAKSGFGIEKHFSRDYVKGEDILTIAAMGGSSRITYAINSVLEYNKEHFEESDNYSKIIILTDHDDEKTISDKEKEVENNLKKNGCLLLDDIRNNAWVKIEYTSKMGMKMNSKVLLLIIPIDEKGAIETFILNAIGDSNEYDRSIIEQGNNFVDKIDPEERYLNHRRLKIKAKYEVFFAVRATAEKHNDRDSVMKSIPWINYSGIQNGFEKLREI